MGTGLNNSKIKIISESNLEVFKSIVLNDKGIDRPKLRCIFFDSENNYVVATDANKMLIVEKNVDKTKLIDFKTKKEIEGTYVDYQAVIPIYEKGVENISAKEILNNTKTLAHENKKIKYQGDKKRVCFEIDNENIYFDPQFLNEGLQAMSSLGYNKVAMLYQKPERAVVFLSEDNLVRLLVMPMIIQDDVQDDVSVTSIGNFKTINNIKNNPKVIEYKIKSELSEGRFGLKHRILEFIKEKQNESIILDYFEKALKESINENLQNINYIYNNAPIGLVNELKRLIREAQSLLGRAKC